MLNLKKAFGEEGICLQKKVSVHLSLQKGKENGKKLGSFSMDMDGCCNIARKLAFILAILLAFILLPMLFGMGRRGKG